MIDVYAFATPSGVKIPIALEELGLAYTLHGVNVRKGEQKELAADGITANAIAPGPTEKELFRANNPPGSEGEARYLAQIPMGRLGRTEEISAAILFLASDAAASITGQTLPVEGGASLGRSAG